MEKCIINYKFPSDFVKLNYSVHARSKLKDRTTGSLILAPSIIRLTKDNTTDLKVKGRRVVACTAMLEYKKGIYMYLPLIVYGGIVKTVYFDTHKTETGLLYSEKKRRIEENISFKDRTEVLREIFYPEEVLETKNTGAETTGIRGFRENVGVIQSIMGKTTITKKVLELWSKYIWRK